MSLPDDNSNKSALSREWAAARIVVIGGLVVAIAVAGYFAYRARTPAVLPLQTVVPAAAKPDAKLLARVELAVCTTVVKRAMDIGIIPTYGRLDTPQLVKTDVAHRFVCVGATHAAKYYVAADLRCNNLVDPQCVSVYRVALRDGTLLYSRPQ